ncbi:hypothetical protein EDB84DRAFT_176701 [Lactarius hengduanensis]|nr:hypothetical protein EDB84DRAFT_176701 [Lactarius hengduanensis]
MKDKHEDQESCAHCSIFKWSRGRPHLYRRHLRAKHSELTSSGDPPGSTRKAHVLRARQYKFPNNRSQVVSREPPIPYSRDLREGSSYTLTSNEAAILSPLFSCRGTIIISWATLMVTPSITDRMVPLPPHIHLQQPPLFSCSSPFRTCINTTITVVVHCSDKNLLTRLILVHFWSYLCQDRIKYVDEY